MNSQKEWLSHIEETTGQPVFVVDKTSDFATTNRVRLDESECLLDPTRPVIGRFRVPGEIVWDFECMLSKEITSHKEIAKGWLDNALPPTDLMSVWLKNNKIPFIPGDSGRGTHVHIFTKGLIEFALEDTGIGELNKDGTMIPEIKEYEVALWEIISERAGVAGLPGSDNSIMNRRGQTIVRAFGGFNAIPCSYKSLLVNGYKEFPEIDKVVFPEKIELWEVPETLLEEVKLRIKQKKAFDEGELPDNSVIVSCHYINYAKENYISGGNRNNHLVKNLMILVNRMKIPEQEKLELIKTIADRQKTSYGEYMGWYEKAKSGELNDHFNCGEIVNFVKKCHASGIDMPLFCLRCQFKEFKDIVRVDKLESINLESHADKTIICRATPLRMQGGCRALAYHYRCNKCNEVIITNHPLPKKERIHDCEKYAELKLTHREDQAGFKLWMINESTEITSTESLLAWIPFSAVGIDSQNYQHMDRIYEFFKNVGNEVELTGKLRPIEIFNKKNNTMDVNMELVVEHAKAVDPLDQYKFDSQKLKVLKDNFGSIDWNDKSFLDTIFVPRIKGRALLKELTILTMLTPLKLNNNSGDPEWGVGRGAVFGDGGSVHKDSEVVVRDNLTKEIRKTTISEFYELYHAEGSHKNWSTPSGLIDGLKWKRISAVSKHISSDNLIRIELDSSHWVIGTKDHSFIKVCNNKFIEVEGSSIELSDMFVTEHDYDSLAESDEMFIAVHKHKSYPYSYSKVIEILELPNTSNEDVYDMEVDDTNTFIANGILVHNSAKSKLVSSMINTYMPNLNAYLISAESMSTVGFSGAVVKEDDTWVIRWGYATFAHNGFLCLDGLHMWDKNKIASLRELESQNKAKIDKAAKGERPCAFRGIKIANCRFPVREKYWNKYKASFDIGNGANDEANKFSGPDRRRVDWIYVVSQDEIDREEIDLSNLNYVMKNPSESLEEDYKEPITELIKFAWTRKPDDIVWVNRDKLISKVLKYRKIWASTYPSLELRTINNEGQLVILKYAVASAVMHARIDENGKVLVTEEDIDFVYKIFSEMMEYLEMSHEVKRRSVNSRLAKAVSESLTEEQVDTILLLYKHGGAKRVVEEGAISNKTIYNHVSKPISVFFEGQHYEYVPKERAKKGSLVIDALFDRSDLTDFGRTVALILEQEYRPKKEFKSEQISGQQTLKKIVAVSADDKSIVKYINGMSNPAGKALEVELLFGHDRIEEMKKKGLIIENPSGTLMVRQ